MNQATTCVKPTVASLMCQTEHIGYRSGRSFTWLKIKNPDYER